MSNDELIEQLESAANFLRGMGFDPAIPKHAKEAIAAKVRDLDAVIEKALVDK